MKRLLFIPLLALPLLFVSCDGEIPGEPATGDDAAEPQFVTIQGAPETAYVKAKLRCGHNVTGHVDIQVWHGPPTSIPASNLETLNCGETFKFQLGSVPYKGQLWSHFDVTKEGGPLVQCPTPTGYFQDYIPVRRACGKLAVVSARYTKK